MGVLIICDPTLTNADVWQTLKYESTQPNFAGHVCHDYNWPWLKPGALLSVFSNYWQEVSKNIAWGLWSYDLC